MRKSVVILLSINLFFSSVYSQDSYEEDDFIKNESFTKVSLEKIFETDKAVLGWGDLRFVSISNDDQYLGMFFIDPLVKTFKYKLFKIDNNSLEEIDLKGDLSPIESMDCSIGFSKDSKQFYTLTTNMEVYIWSVETGNLLKKVKGRDRKEMKSPYAFVKNGQFQYDEISDQVISNGFIVFGDYLYLFNGLISSGFSESAEKIKLKTSPTRIDFSKDNKFIGIVGLFSKELDIYDVEKGKLISSINSIKKPINSIQFIPQDNRIVMSEKFNMSISDFNSQDAKELFSLDKRCYTMDVNKRGLLAYAESPSYTTKVWDLKQSKLLFETPSLFKNITYELRLSNDGKYLYAVSARGKVVCWKISYI